MTTIDIDIDIDILILADGDSSVASELAGVHWLGDLPRVVTEQCPYSPAGAVEGYDLIILDEQSQGSTLETQRQKRDTLGLCSRLRQNTDAVILLLSFIDDEDYAVEAYNAGIDEEIVKPISLLLLGAKLSAWQRW